MSNDKNKLSKFTVIMCITCVILTGINYITFKNTVMGIAFIICTIGSIVNIIAYNINRQNIKNNK